MTENTCKFCIHYQISESKCRRLFDYNTGPKFVMDEDGFCSSWKPSDGVESQNNKGRFVYYCKSCGRRVTKWLAGTSFNEEFIELCPDCEIDGYPHKEEHDDYFPCAACLIEDCLSPDCTLDDYSRDDRFDEINERDECLPPEEDVSLMYGKDAGLSEPTEDGDNPFPRFATEAWVYSLEEQVDELDAKITSLTTLIHNQVQVVKAIDIRLSNFIDSHNVSWTDSDDLEDYEDGCDISDQVHSLKHDVDELNDNMDERASYNYVDGVFTYLEKEMSDTSNSLWKYIRALDERLILFDNKIESRANYKYVDDRIENLEEDISELTSQLRNSRGTKTC